MRIIIDMQACQNDSRFRGIGRYSTGMITAFLQLAQKQHECYLLFNGMFEDNLAELMQYYSAYVPNHRMKIWYGLGPTEARDTNNIERKKISTIVREKFIEKLNPDIVFMTTFFEGFGDNTILSVPKKRDYQIIATSHDLIPMIQQSLYLDPHPVFKEYYLDQVSQFKHVDGFTAVSESSKQELIQYLDIQPHKIVNTLEGIEEQFTNSFPTLEKIEKIIGINPAERKIILYFGASDERKNHLKLIKSYSMLSYEDRQRSLLLLVGILNDDHVQKFKSYAERCGLQPHEYIILKRVTDKEVIDLYSFCYLFVFPSFHEGFGLPALEAMACGTAVITANTTSLPEVIGRDDLTFDPYNSLQLKKLLEKFIADEAYRNEIAAYCEAHAKNFNWHKTAQVALDFMNQRDSQHKSAKSVSLEALRNACVHEIKNQNLTVNLLQHEKEALALNIIKNFREERKPRIYYDISKMITVEFHTGIQRVTTEIFNQIQHHYADQFEIIPIKIAQDGEFLIEVKTHALSRKNSIEYSSADINDIRPGDIYISVDLDHAANTKSRAYRMLRNRGCKTHFIIHDLLPLDLGDNFFSPNSALAHYRWLNEIAKADAIICVSKSVMEHANYYLNAIPQVNPHLQLGWFHLGANFATPKEQKQSTQSAQKFQKINLDHPIFFMVGSVEPRKGHLEVIEAMTDLWDEGYQGSLVIAGARGWNNELVVELTNASQYKDKFLFWPQKVSDDDLAYLYSKSTALIAASLGEGFGLPLIEAMQHDTDVIARDIPVFKEVTHGTSTYFSTTQELKEIILNYKKQSQPQVKSFQSWEESAHQLMDLILDSNYPIEWKRDETVQLYPICAEQFNTTVGVFNSDRIRTAHQAGLLIWGGYFPLEAGHYQLKIYGRSQKRQKIDIEISVNKDDVNHQIFNAAQVQLQRSRSIYDIPEVLVDIHVRTPEDLKRAELYIHVQQDNDLYITGFEFIRDIQTPVSNELTHADVRPYALYADEFNTTVGTSSIDRIRTNNKEGLLVWGGYFPIQAGQYQLKVYGGSAKKQSIDLEVSVHRDGQNQPLFAASDIELAKSKSKSNESDVMTECLVNIPEDLARAEIYVWVKQDNDLYITEFEFIRDITADIVHLDDPNQAARMGVQPSVNKQNKSWKKYFHDFWTA